MSDLTAIEKANIAWGTMPDWIEVLAHEVDQTSQGQVSKRLGKSAATISLVLGKKPGPNYEVMETAVRTSLMAGTVDCPFQGDQITLETCLRNQAHAKAGNRLNGFRIHMARACQACKQWRD